MLYLASKKNCERVQIRGREDEDGGTGSWIQVFLSPINLLHLNAVRDNERLKCNYGSGRLIALYFVPIEQG